MKLFIASDIHGDLDSAEKLVEAYKASKADKMILLGDILYHGPRNDLPATYAPRAVIELLNSIKDELLCVRGNCDTEVDQMVLDFPLLADYTWISVDGISMLATQGHNYNQMTPPPLKKGDILLCGHTHIPLFQNFGKDNMYINPGSVSIPKENSQRGYIIYENREFLFCTLEGAVYDSVEI